MRLEQEGAQDAPAPDLDGVRGRRVAARGPGHERRAQAREHRVRLRVRDLQVRAGAGRRDRSGEAQGGGTDAGSGERGGCGGGGARGVPGRRRRDGRRAERARPNRGGGDRVARVDLLTDVLTSVLARCCIDKIRNKAP